MGLILAIGIGGMDAEAGEDSKQRNVLLICVDDLRPELGSYGKQYIQSPHMDRLAAEGILFERHYVQAPTCGASRFTLLTGKYGSYGNGSLFSRALRLKADRSSEHPAMPAWFRQQGYTTVSVGKVSHHPGGRGGRDWDSEDEIEMPNSWDRHILPAGPWKHPRGAMHGLAHGEIRVNAKDMDLYQLKKGPDSIYPDGLIVDEALNQMNQLSEGESPFFLAVGIIRPHLPFGAPDKYMAAYRDIELPKIQFPGKPEGKTTWHGSGEFMKYNRWGRNPNNDAEFAELVRKHYAACVTYADALIGRLVSHLKKLGEYENTVIVVWGDHGWNLGEHNIWGKHCLFEESLRSPLIIRAPGMEHSGVRASGIVETIDIFPTLCELTGLKNPEFGHGVSLARHFDDPDHEGKPAFSYTGAKSIRTDRYRLIEHKDGHVELYDHFSPEKERNNIADSHPGVVQRLKEILDRRDKMRGPVAR